MKVTHVIHSIDRSKGGPSTYMQLLTGQLADYCQLEALSLSSPDPIPLDQRIKYHTVAASKLGLFGYAPGFKSYIENCSTDLFHGNGLWQYPVHAMTAVARNRKIPYILSTHGMLEPWSMTQGKLKKQLALKLFQNRDLQQANVIHCTAEMEAETIRKLGYKPPVAVIPNGIDETEFEIVTKKQNRPRQLLFLSRIHRKKGLEMLFRAFSKLDQSIRKEWELIIAGSGEPEYLNYLKQVMNGLGIREQVIWRGQVHGEDRKQLLQKADLFILPTFSENFGIVVAEALASGVPVITTHGAPWEDLVHYGCGWWVEPTENELLKVLTDTLRMPGKDLTDMGLKGRKLVEEKYSIRKVADQMLELYRWVLGECKKPEFVV